MNKKRLTIVGVAAIILIPVILLLLRFTPEPVINFFALTQKHSVEAKLEKKYQKEFDVLEVTDCYQGTKSFLTEQIRKFGCYVYKYRAVCLEDDIEFDVEYRTDPSNVRFEDSYVFVSNIISNDYTKQIEDAYAAVFPEYTVSATWNTEISAPSLTRTEHRYKININIDALIDDCLEESLPKKIDDISNGQLLSVYRNITTIANENEEVEVEVVLFFKEDDSPQIEILRLDDGIGDVLVSVYRNKNNTFLNEKYDTNEILRKIEYQKH